MMINIGFVGSMAQLVGFTVGIYWIYDWNEMEPYTWIFCKYIPLILLIYFLPVYRGILFDGRILLLLVVKVRLGLHIRLQQHDVEQAEKVDRKRGLRYEPS